MNNNCITTYTGRHIDPLHPDPDMICIEDIAHALSLICRGNGQVKTFFSVGQHCINCAREALARGYSRRVPDKPKPVFQNRFNNFHQRDYDFAEYERQLLKRE